MIDAYNHTELLAADIRRRLQSGAGMERGRLGVSTVAMESLEECLEYSGKDGSVGNICGLDIEPVERLAYQVEELKRHPNAGAYVIV